jgi:N utilization substance protein A
LFEVEVGEIADGTVKIEAFAREPGYRTKIAVTSTDPKVDPVGACVGARGARVKTIVRELNGEKVDIINWFTDPKQMVLEAMKPAVPRDIVIDDRSKRILLRVATDDLAIAIGKKGQNARLTSRLIGWRIDIEEHKTEVVNPRTQAVQSLVAAFELNVGLAERLVAVGINSPAAFEGVDAETLIETGFSAEEAAAIMQHVSGA